MANSLINRNAADRALNLARLSLGFLRNLSIAASPPSASSSVKKNPKRKKKKKKNLFEVAQFLPNWAIGYHIAKSHWTDVSYQITKINLYKDGRHGKAWGIAHKDGLPIADAPKKISGVHKRCWRYLPNLSNSSGTLPSLIKQTETPKAEAQAA